MPPRIPLAPGYFFCSWQSRQEPWSLPHRFPPGRSRVLINRLTVLPTAPLAINLVDRPHSSASNVTLKLPADWRRTKACTPPYFPAGSSQECARCHSEHNGEDFPLIKWDVKAFNHKDAGYVLEGKHAGLDCNKCHNPSRISPQERASIKVKDPAAPTWVFRLLALLATRTNTRGDLDRIV